MSIALAGGGWWRSACEAAGEAFDLLPVETRSDRNPYALDLNARAALGKQWQPMLGAQGCDLILDNGAQGMVFLQDPIVAGSAKLLHEAVNVPLASHWIDPVVTVFQALPWAAAWQCLQSETWFKFVWDKVQCDELRHFGVGNVHHLPMAACDRAYHTEPLDPSKTDFVVSFVGNQNTNYFAPNQQVSTQQLLAGSLANAVRAEMPDVSFYDVYFTLHQLAEPPSKDEPLEARIAKAQKYFSDKLFYNASLCLKQRDRFVIFLKHRLEDTFTLIGRRWDTAYRLSCHPPLPTVEAYLAHFRKSAINLNFVNGNAESGLNMRHFEITAAGGFMLCQHQAEIEDSFEVGKECDTFRNEQELLEKIQLYLQHPKERAAIAQAGQRRTLENHLYSHRLVKIRETVASSRQPAAAAPDLVGDAV